MTLLDHSLGLFQKADFDFTTERHLYRRQQCSSAISHYDWNKALWNTDYVRCFTWHLRKTVWHGLKRNSVSSLQHGSCGQSTLMRFRYLVKVSLPSWKTEPDASDSIVV